MRSLFENISLDGIRKAVVSYLLVALFFLAFMVVLWVIMILIRLVLG